MNIQHVEGAENIHPCPPNSSPFLRELSNQSVPGGDVEGIALSGNSGIVRRIIRTPFLNPLDLWRR
jgi:hypothetical protein